MGAFTLNNKKHINESLEKVFAIFPRLKERQNQRAGTLSSGEQQMVAIGRALMLKPKLLLVDEFSLGLSPNYVQLVLERLKDIGKIGSAVLLVEQNARKALEYSNRGYAFRLGEVVVEGPSCDLLRNKNVTELLGGHV
jgi:branched-chain amino acid transport system ATP-binding protein